MSLLSKLRQARHIESVEITLLPRYAIFQGADDQAQKKIQYSSIPDLRQFTFNLQEARILMLVFDHHGPFTKREARGLVHASAAGLWNAFERKQDLAEVESLTIKAIPAISQQIDYPLQNSRIKVTKVFGTI